MNEQQKYESCVNNFSFSLCHLPPPHSSRAAIGIPIVEEVYKWKIETKQM